MNCDEATLLLVRQADQPLAEDARAALARHLDACAACREVAGAQVVVAALLRSRPAAAAPADLAGRVAARVALEGGWFGLADWRAWTLRVAPIAAALVVVAVLAGGGTSAEPAFSLTSLAETWAAGDRIDGPPATSVFWQVEAGADTLLLTILTAGPDDVLEPSEGREGVK